ncbi:MAG TPA: sugar phosphate isomerase/epimerase [Chitinophagaceae bacterium]|nr:sugar phosphate isomerase/epimerase [Chitinophagaceae bacterium]
MKHLKIILLLIVFAIPNTRFASAQKTPEKLGWKLGTQAYSFRMFTLEQALDKADSIGIKYVEGFPGQKIGAGIEGTMDYHMPVSRRDSVLRLLRKKGIKIVSYGVVTPNTENDWLQLFEFAKGMKLKQFASEPDPKFIPLVSKLADDYKINVAIHNHPRPSRYWHPDTLIKYTAGYSKRLGSCSDIGHWVRSGLDPIEMMKKLEGRIFELHMKDLHELPNAEYLAFQTNRPERIQGAPGAGQGANRPQPPAGPHDVPWGTGISNIKGVLEELLRQKFKGPIFAEYEYNWMNNAPEIAQSLKYVREVVKSMK